MYRSPLLQQIISLPKLVQTLSEQLINSVESAFSDSLYENIERVFITGCGDSYHAALNAELAFEQLAGLPCEPISAMQFARYAAGFLPDTHNLLLAVSVSGQASRTAEALEVGRKAGALAVAITGNPEGALAAVANVALETAVPPLPDAQPDVIVPGARSYIASQLALYLTAIHLGAQRGHLTQPLAAKLRQELNAIAGQMEATITQSDAAARRLARAWQDADRFVFCGSGPNYGAALFSAAKIIEASGDTAVPQDIEEWAHLQYFERQTTTPTFFLNANGWDTGRALEIATAAKTIGRRVAIIAPAGSPLGQTADKDVLLPIAGAVRECFSPLLTCLPALLFAAYRAEVIGESYFRGFGGGRSAQDGGGISRIRTSVRISEPTR